MRKLKYATVLTLLTLPLLTMAGVDSDFKARPTERFTIYTGDGNYKQAYHWSFNEQGQGAPVTIFLNHGSGGEWYDEIESRFGPCGPDNLGLHADAYEMLCQVDDQDNEIYLADFRDHHIPVGPELEEFMLKKIVGSTQFAAWYWQDSFSQFDSPVNIFMVGRYNIATTPSHLDNALYWLNATDQDSMSEDSLPPYNFDGYGLADIAIELRPKHAAPEISGFDNMFLYKAITEQFPEVSLENLIIEGRSNGGSAMIAMAADHHIWSQDMRDFWSRNLPSVEPQNQEVEVTPGLSIDAIINNPVLTTAFNEMLAAYSEQDLLNVIDGGQSLSLAADSQPIAGSAGEQFIANEPEINIDGLFNDNEFTTQLNDYLNGNFYDDVKMAHALYPGCQLGGLMEKDTDLAPGVTDEDGNNANGYKVAIPVMFSFGNEDSLYSSHCDARINDANNQESVSNKFSVSSLSDGTQSVIGEVFSPARHGFDYKDVYKNLSNNPTDQNRANESRRAIERVVHQAFKELGLEGTYTLPEILE